MVLGIVGKKHAGKDTFAGFIKRYNPEYQILHYADRLKEVCTKVFPIPAKCYYEPELKEVAFDQAIMIDSYLPSMEEELGVKLHYENLLAMNPRQLLQLVGTQYVRNHHPHYWTDYLKNKIVTDQPDPETRCVIVPDVRFENEGKVLTDLPNGRLLKVIRNSQISTDRHASEREQDGIDCPSFYLNDNELYLSEMLAFLFASGHVGQAYDFVARSLTRHPSVA